MNTDRYRQRALATRSLTEADRLTGKEREDAIQAHGALVWPTKACSLVGDTTRF